MSQQKYQTLITVLHECMEACNHCYDSCLKEENVKMMENCIRLDRECADICGYLEQALSRNSSFASEIASLCAQICETCGNECKQHNYEHCQKCADSCLKCAEECRKFVA